MTSYGWTILLQICFWIQFPGKLRDKSWGSNSIKCSVKKKRASFQAQMGPYFEFPLIFNFVFVKTNSNTIRSLTWSRKPTTRSSVGMRPGKPIASTAILVLEFISPFQSVRHHSIFRTFGYIAIVQLKAQSRCTFIVHKETELILWNAMQILLKPEVFFDRIYII